MKTFSLLIIFIVLTIGLAWYFITKDKGKKEPTSALWEAFMFGIVCAVAAIIIENFFVSLKSTQVGTPILQLIINFLKVGFIEEIIKFLPLAIFIYHKRYFNQFTDGIIYFSLVGLSFGLIENFGYVLGFGASDTFARLFLTPFFHASTVAIVGFYLIKKKINHQKSFKMVIFALIGVIVLHTIYDTGLTVNNQLMNLLSIIISVGLAINLFLMYFRARDLDQIYGLAEVGINNFCRHCGQKNKYHLLYCTRCGYHA